MGKDRSSSTTGVLPPEVRGLFSGASAQLLDAQRRSPLTDYQDPYPAQTEGFDPLEQYGASLVPGMVDPTAAEGMALRDILRMPDLAAAGPTTGYEDSAQIPGLGLYMDALGPGRLSSPEDPDFNAYDALGPELRELPGGPGNPGNPGGPRPNRPGGPITVPGRSGGPGGPVPRPQALLSELSSYGTPDGADEYGQPLGPGGRRWAPHMTEDYDASGLAGNQALNERQWGPGGFAEGGPGTESYKKWVRDVYQQKQDSADAKKAQWRASATPEQATEQDEQAAAAARGDYSLATGRPGGRGPVPGDDVRLSDMMGHSGGGAMVGGSTGEELRAKVAADPRSRARSEGDYYAKRASEALAGGDTPRMPPSPLPAPPSRPGSIGSTASRLTGGMTLEDSPGVAQSRRRVAGEGLTDNPEIRAALDAHRKLVAPGIENQYTLAGLGRSTALPQALALSEASMLPGLYEGAFGREERGLQRELGATEEELGRRERSSARRAEATQAGVDRMLGLSSGLTGRRAGAAQLASEMGGGRRRVGQQARDRQYDDFLRRMGITESSTTGPFGILSGGALGSVTRSGGGLFK